MSEVRPKFLQAKADWIASKRQRGVSKRTVEVYLLALKRLAEFAGARDPLDLKAADLVLFCGVWLHKRGLSSGGRATHVSALREFYRWAHAHGLTERDLSRAVDYPRKPRPLPPVMTLASLERLLWQPDLGTFAGLRDATLMMVLAATGVRVSGLCGLNESDLIEDYVDKDKRLFVRVTEKGGRTREVPLGREAELMMRLYLQSPELAEIDRDLPDGDKLLFVVLRNTTVSAKDFRGEERRISRGAVWDVIKKHGKAAGIPPDQLHPHALRHLFGTELEESGVGMLTAQNLMGHADPKSTSIYVHMARRKLSRELDRANPVGKINTPVSQILTRLKGEKSPGPSRAETTGQRKP